LCNTKWQKNISLVLICAITAVILLNINYIIIAFYQILFFVATKSPEQTFLPAPKPIASINVQESRGGGMGTIWDSWEQKYTISESVASVQTYYTQEMEKYCVTDFDWVEEGREITAKCYIDPCEPPDMPEYNVTGRGPYQTFYVSIALNEDGITRVLQSSFRSADVCFDHSS